MTVDSLGTFAEVTVKVLELVLPQGRLTLLGDKVKAGIGVFVIE